MAARAMALRVAAPLVAGACLLASRPSPVFTTLGAQPTAAGRGALSSPGSPAPRRSPHAAAGAIAYAGNGESEDVYQSSRGAGLLSAAGAVLAGVVLMTRKKRRCNVSMGPTGGIGQRWRNLYGDKNDQMRIVPFKELTMDPSEAREFPDTKGLVRPDWLTLEKWESWPSRLKIRHPSWWFQVCDQKTGELIYDHKWEYSVEKAISETVRMYEIFPREPNPKFKAWFVMNLDPKYPDQQIRTSIELPHGIGSEVKVAVFCGEDDEEKVLSMGAYKAGRTLMEAIEAEEIDFDVLIAKPQMMPQLAKLGKVLGPRRLMPSPKSGTVITDYEAAIKQFSKGSTVELRTGASKTWTVDFGRMSMSQDQLVENFNALIKGIIENAPAGAENPLFLKARIHCMGRLPNFRIDQSNFPTIQRDDD